MVGKWLARSDMTRAPGRQLGEVQTRKSGCADQGNVSEHSEKQMDAGYMQKVRAAGLGDGLDMEGNGESMGAENDSDTFTLVMGWKVLLSTSIV